MHSQTLWAAAALVLVVEGLLPLVAPQSWRSVFERLLQLSNGQVRFYGLCSVLIGLVLLWLA